MIQIDEAALREGLPLRRSEWQAYLDWAVESFRICSSGVGDETQIHTHMCYSEFNDIIEAIGAMDADVISIETSRSEMELLEAFRSFVTPTRLAPACTTSIRRAFPRSRDDELLTREAAAFRRAALGQSRLRPEDPQMGGGPSGAGEHGRRRPRIAHPALSHRLSRLTIRPPSHKENAMRFWIECTRFETGQPYHVNISLVGGMWRDGERTILAFVGRDAQKVEVKETLEQILGMHLGPAATAR